MLTLALPLRRATLGRLQLMLQASTPSKTTPTVEDVSIPKEMKQFLERSESIPIQ